MMIDHDSHLFEVEMRQKMKNPWARGKMGSFTQKSQDTEETKNITRWSIKIGYSLYENPCLKYFSKYKNDSSIL